MDELKWIEIEKNGIMYNYENIYEIFINGDIKRFFKNGNTLIMKPGNDKDGYKIIGLRKGGEKKEFFKIHRIIATAFIPNPDNKEDIDHLDGNKANNSIDNLRWVTCQENNLNKKNYGKYKKGVTFHKRAQKFCAQITVNKKQIHIGSYETEDEAHEAFRQKFIESHGIEPCSR